LQPPLTSYISALYGFFTGRPGSIGLHDAEGLRSPSSDGDASALEPLFELPSGVPEPGRGRLSVARRGWPTVSSLGFDITASSAGM